MTSSMPLRTGACRLPADVRREVIDLWHMGKEGGYILSPSHDITSDVPLENLVALVETVKELERT